MTAYARCAARAANAPAKVRSNASREMSAPAYSDTVSPGDQSRDAKRPRRPRRATRGSSLGIGRTTVPMTVPVVVPVPVPVPAASSVCRGTSGRGTRAGFGRSSSQRVATTDEVVASSSAAATAAGVRRSASETAGSRPRSSRWRVRWMSRASWRTAGTRRARCRSVRVAFARSSRRWRWASAYQHQDAASADAATVASRSRVTSRK